MKMRMVRNGRAAIEELRTAIGLAKADDPLAPVTVVVRDEIAGIVARRALASGVAGRSGVAGVTFTTLTRLAEQLLTSAGDIKPPLLTPILAALWRRELTDRPGCLAEVAAHPATVRAVTRVHRELRAAGGAGAEALASSGELGRDIVRMHRAVVAASDGYRDEVETLVGAAALVGRTAAAPTDVILQLPDQLTLPEREFVAALRRHDRLSAVVGDSGDPRADEPVLRSLGLERTAASATAPVASRVIHASDADDEVRVVVRRVAEALRSVKAHRIAVLFPKQLPYARLLHEHFAAAGITVNGPGVRAVRDRAIADGLLTLLALDPHDFRRGDLFDWFGRAPVLRGDDARRVPTTRWERVSRKAGVVGGDDWAVRLAAHAHTLRATVAELAEDEDPPLGRIAGLEREAEAAADLAAFVAQLRDQLAALHDARTWESSADGALALFHRCYGRAEDMPWLPEAEQRAVIAVEQTLVGLRWLDALEERVDVALLRDVLEVELDAARPRVGRFGEGVYVGPIASAPGLELDRVFVVGLSEDLYPGRRAPDPLLPDELRARSDGAFETSADRLARDHRSLLAAFAAADDVTATFPRGDLRRSSERLPSRWLMPTLRALTGDDVLEATAWAAAPADGITGSPSHWHEVRHAELPASDQEWRLRHLEHGAEPDDDPTARADELIRGRRGSAFGRFDGNLAGVPGLPVLSGGQIAVSPTALESFAKCPHAYFMERMLRVAPIEQPEDIVTISAKDAGSLIHEVMDELVDAERDALPGFGEPWTPAQRQRMRVIAARVADGYMTRGLTGHPTLWQREREAIEADLEAILDDDDAFRRARNARVVASELPFGQKGIDPILVTTPRGRVAMKGSADRVDETQDGVLIVSDIKTGSATSFRPIAKDPVVGGTKLQLPAYAHAARARYGNEQVEARYWFARKSRGTDVRVELTDELAVRYAEVVDALVAGIEHGAFVPKPPSQDDYLWVTCPTCDPDGLGYGELRGEYARKRGDDSLAELIALIDPISEPEGAR